MSKCFEENSLKDLYNTISNEIEFYHNLILDLSRENPKIKDLYKGCHILFSPLILKPKILLIGYNPGGGYFKWHKKIVENFNAMTHLEYFLNNHNLGEQTKNLFKVIGKEKELQNSTVKINFYPWATNDLQDFRHFMKFLPNNLSSELFELSRVWNKKLISIINPDIIICEGFATFSEVETLYNDKINFSMSDFHKIFENDNGQKIFAYKRNKSSILKKTELSKELIKII